MKKIFLLAATALLMACGGAKVKVTNPLKLDRTNETVEISWQEVQAKVSDATPENIVVIAPDGSQQPSQVLYNGGTEPQALIFQATVAGNSSATYTLETGQREAYPAQAFGRYVPERMDDFAWENNLIAHRMYGPALEATGEISNGIDIWLKRTDSLIIDKWFKPGYNYHSDQGEGLDCYKVGRTLGAGAMAPYEKDSLWLGNNYIRYKVLDNGPIRIAFQLDYAPFLVDSVEVTERRTISLDANTHFNNITEEYTGDFDQLKVAAGIVTRGAGGKVLDILNKPIKRVGYWEPLNTDNKPDNGHTTIGLVFPCEIKVETRLGHLLASTTIPEGKPFIYQMGAGWSKSDIPTPDVMKQLIWDQSLKFDNPLTVTVK
ncbi:DUF4861 family protein [Millionella massiliensis]|uniref:DUF4861 family protein n=1 Tax=Millionella massiliensis TaxID=1871023 RepID=UPI0009F3B834|nr:DUF4861 family protein [Millionella massiliensis]